MCVCVCVMTVSRLFTCNNACCTAPAILQHIIIAGFENKSVEEHMCLRNQQRARLYVLIRLTRWIIALFNVSWSALLYEKKKKSLVLITVYELSFFSPRCPENKTVSDYKLQSWVGNEKCFMYRSAFVLCALYAETLSKILGVAEGTAFPLLFWVCSDFRCIYFSQTPSHVGRFNNKNKGLGQ